MSVGSVRTVPTNAAFVLGVRRVVDTRFEPRTGLVEFIFCRFWSKCPIAVNSVAKYFCTLSEVHPGHVTKFWFLIALTRVDFCGLKHVACSNSINSCAKEERFLGKLLINCSLLCVNLVK